MDHHIGSRKALGLLVQEYPVSADKQQMYNLGNEGKSFKEMLQIWGQNMSVLCQKVSR